MNKIYHLKNTVALITALVIVFTITGCNGGNSKAWEIPEINAVESGIIADNDNFSLEWNNEEKQVFFIEKADDTVWGTVPAEAFLLNERNDSLFSPIQIEVSENISKALDFTRSYGSAVLNNNVDARLIDNGIELTYYFEEFKISVPVQFIIREDSFAISIIKEKITEGDTHKLLSISLAPYVSACKNGAEDSYLFVPSGNGGLIYTNSDTMKNYSTEVYGTDYSRVLFSRYVEEEHNKMPVFGIKNKDKALLSIIEEGAEAAQILASTGDKDTGYSSVYAKCFARGFDIYAEELDSNSTTITTVAENISRQSFTVGYYPLSNENANYNGMAKKYKEYLTDNGMQKTDAASALYSISVIGGAKVKRLALGIPYQTRKSATTFAEAAEIISRLKNDTGSMPFVQMIGFGSSGIDVGKIAGGYKLLGKKSDMEKLISDYKDYISFDFDVIKFKSSGAGVSTLNGAAKSANLQKSKRFFNDPALRDYDKEIGGYYLVKRSKLSGIINKVTNLTAKNGIANISLATLGEICYSDYSNSEYEMKANTESDVEEYLKNIRSKNIKITTDNANAYAAKFSDNILNLQIEDYGYDEIDQYIPFYQMVFVGTKNIYSEPLNSADDRTKVKLGALSSGVRFGYNLLKNYSNGFISKTNVEIYSALFSDNVDEITKEVSEYSKYYSLIQGAAIDEYTILENGVIKTVFDNGVVAYTNMSSTEKDTEIGTISENGFVYINKNGDRNEN
ncbi:MAG: hypothetical protein E7545_02630 [Ruminococcaceae bacterium]|nr:hypothetical protein [Oscillospiraceae bacterium]